MVLYRNFVTPEEIEHIERLVQGHLSRSKVVGDGNATVDSGRTSTGVFLSGMLRTGVVNAVEERIANATRLPIANGEDFYYLRYELGQDYLPHTDYCYRPPPKGSPPGVGLKASCKDRFLRLYSPDDDKHVWADRVATAIIQLRAPERGGETAFPAFNARGLPVNEGFLSAGGSDQSWMSQGSSYDEGEQEEGEQHEGEQHEGEQRAFVDNESDEQEGRRRARALLISDTPDDAAFEAAKRREEDAKAKAKRDQYMPPVEARRLEGEGAIDWPGHVMTNWATVDHADDARLADRQKVRNYDPAWCSKPNGDGVLRVSPNAGDMVLFYNFNMDGSNDGAALHGGCPVKAGEKHIMTKWIRGQPHNAIKRHKYPAPWEASEGG